ncbi:hypothetical protein D3C85_1536360 [compost metagenome]
MARSLNREANTSLAARITLSTPRMLRKVSCWPAKEASGRSSAVAEERTATAMFGLPADISAKALRMSASSWAGNSASITH